ncbi:MAG: hypothetical protein C4345_12740 [Chloroflexota bacterium]
MLVIVVENAPPRLRGRLAVNGILEEVFARPGLGKLMVGATKQRDYTALQSIMVVYALIIVIINLLTGIVYTFVDPRVRLHA